MDRKKIFPMLKGVLVLAAIALVCGLLLGFFNILTYVDPLQSTLDGFKSDSGAEGEFEMIYGTEKGDAVASGEGSVVYYARSSDGVHAFLTEGSSRYGEVQLYIYIREGSIYKIVLKSFTDDFGGNLTQDFFSQFYGKDLSALDAMSGDTVSNATYSSSAAQKAVDAAAEYYLSQGGEGNE